MRFGAIFFVVIVASFAACKSPRAGEYSNTLGASDDVGHGGMKAHGRIESTRAIRFRLDEFSGMDSIVDPRTGRVTIFGVGDRNFEISSSEFSRDFTTGNSTIADLKKLVSHTADESQWEGIAIDAKGLFFVLEESPGAVYVFDSTANRLIQDITLDYKHEGLRAKGFEENSLGEGIALLQNGHVLILKEKDPAMLIEFGPEGSDPIGVSPETLIKKREAFKLSDGETIKYKPLKWWRFTDNANDLMHDISEIAVGPDGTLYALSDESDRLARLETNLRIEEDNVNIKEYWDLPKSMEHPEALTFVGGAPVIGVDSKDAKENLFIFGPLPE